MKPRTRFWNSTWNWAFKSCSLVWVKLKDTLKSNIIKHYLRLCSEGWSSIKKFAEIEICNEIVDIFMLDMSSKHIFYPKIAEEGKNCSKLEEPQKVAQKLPGTIGTGLTNGINQVGKMSNFIRWYNLSFLVVKILLFNLHVLGWVLYAYYLNTAHGNLTSCKHVWGVSKFSLPVLKTSETLHFYQYLEVKLLSTYFLLLYHKYFNTFSIISYFIVISLNFIVIIIIRKGLKHYFYFNFLDVFGLKTVHMFFIVKLL